MAELTEGMRAGEFFASEACGHRSREEVTILSGENVVAGEILGKVTYSTPATGTADGGNTGDGTMTAVTAGDDAKVGTYTATCIEAGSPTAGTASGAAVAGNAGDGTITAAPAVGAGAKPGVYTLTCVEPATDAGEFIVEDPDGINIGVATVAVEFTEHLTFTIADGSTDFAAGDQFAITVAAVDGDGGTFSVVDPDGNRIKDAGIGAYTSEQINFTINDGSTDFAVGDAFTVAVAAGSLKYVAYDQDATDGSQIAAGASYGNYDATGGDVTGVAVVRDAELNGNDLTWPSDITADEKTAAIAQLADIGILVRT
jgi:hypothetical protein